MDFRDTIRQNNMIMEAAQNIPMGKLHLNHAILTEATANTVANKGSRKWPKPELSDSDKAATRRKVKKLFENTEPDFNVSPVALGYKLHEAVNGTVSLSSEDLTNTPASYLTECLNEKREIAYNWISSVIAESAEAPEPDGDKEGKDGKDGGTVESDLDNILGAEGPKTKDPFSEIPDVDPDTVTVVTVNDEEKEPKPGEAKPEDKPEGDKPEPEPEPEPESAVKELSERVEKIETSLDQLLEFFEKLVPFEEAEHKVDLNGDGKVEGSKPEDEKPEGDKPSDTLTENEEKGKIAIDIANSIANGAKTDDADIAEKLTKYRALSVVTEGEYGVPDAKVKLPTEPAHKKGDAQETAKPVGGDLTSQSVKDNEEKSVNPLPPLGKSAGLASKNNEGHHGEVTPLHGETGAAARSGASKPLPLSQAYVIFEAIGKYAAEVKKQKEAKK